MGATTSVMTFAEFERMPADGQRYELRHGEVIELPPPKHKHLRLQWRLMRMLSSILDERGEVGTEYAFRPAPELEFWYADVAFASEEREAAIDPEGNLMGTPELVIEIVSPSNTVYEMSDREQTCLGGGALEFWLIQPNTRTIRVTRQNGITHTYTTAHSIPLDAFGGGSAAVAEVFGTT